MQGNCAALIRGSAGPLRDVDPQNTAGRSDGTVRMVQKQPGAIQAGNSSPQLQPARATLYNGFHLRYLAAWMR